MLVLRFLRMTVAPGTTAPEESRTVPSTVAASNCANAAAGRRPAARIQARDVRITNANGLCRIIQMPPTPMARQSGLRGREVLLDEVTRSGASIRQPLLVVRCSWSVARGSLLVCVLKI